MSELRVKRIACPKCGCLQIVGNGFTKRGTKRYRCKLGHSFIGPEDRDQIIKKQIISKVRNRRLLEKWENCYGGPL